MKLKTEMTRFAPRDGYICDVEKERKATKPPTYTREIEIDDIVLDGIE